MKENSPICPRLAEIVSAVAGRLSKDQHDQKGGDRLTDDDDEDGCQDGQRPFDQDVRIEEHADGDEEEHSECVAKRQAFLGGAMAEFAFCKHHAGKEGAKCKRHAEELRGAESDAERDGEHAEAEEFARAGMGNPVHRPGNELAAEDKHEGDEERHLHQRHADDAGNAEIEPEQAVEAGRKRLDRRMFTTADAGGCGYQHEREDHGQVLHDQPADGDLAAFRFHEAAFLQRL